MYGVQMCVEMNEECVCVCVWKTGGLSTISEHSPF